MEYLKLKVCEWLRYGKDTTYGAMEASQSWCNDHMVRHGWRTLYDFEVTERPRSQGIGVKRSKENEVTILGNIEQVQDVHLKDLRKWYHKVTSETMACESLQGSQEEQLLLVIFPSEQRFELTLTTACSS